ncbi:regulator [Streptomyces cellostaticus]|uniref:Regulator n=2 Tax=Streptomyces cellostaticus TaxID=67285 RepID=A0A101NJ46_9ACTN|nr:tetratricopeptide repeat protein [Streptomyces cellostaticus]KUM93929.1 regulator [Streptomyces cellostaticus]
MGGIGKTALALEAAHQACGKGWFPGGTLFVDLRGYDDDPVTADQAVLALLDALGVQGPELPSTPARQYDAYRGLLAERQDRTLLILDNASDATQFVPLLPGTDHHRVLITSRDRPDALPVRLIDLETMDPADSVELLTQALRDADDRDERPAREPEALCELARLCGHLPLALQIAAAMLRRRRHRGIASLVTDIEQAGDTTAVLDNGSPCTDLYGRSLVLRAVLETSYRRLPPDQARVLRLLTFAPGPDIGTEAVAALIDRRPETAVELLEDLAAASLVSPMGANRALRWRLHDLVRAFGAQVVAEDARLLEEGKAARERVLAYYAVFTWAADHRLRWMPRMQAPPLRAEALAWLDKERAGLVAAAQWARDERYAPVAGKLALYLAVYLEWRRHFDDWVTVARSAQQAACHIGDHSDEATSYRYLGIALRETGQAEEAIEALTRARDLSRVSGDSRSEANAPNDLGNALRDRGRLAEAVDALDRARVLYEADGVRDGEAMALNNLSGALLDEGRAQEAVDALTRARDLYQAAGDGHRVGTAWHNLGVALWKVGRAQEAIDAYGKSLEICREFEDWYGAGLSLENLANAHQDAQRPAEARTAYLQAAEAFTRAEAPDKAASAQSRADSLT